MHQNTINILRIIKFFSKINVAIEDNTELKLTTYVQKKYDINNID